ncbi:SRPBCC family protein [Erythrobacter sp. EC-HK427]|uniref:SRPBCC family protein n=1 Tax=Erythrobacter sp. EC-HK427 TaxID=2038396 RepID=UPI001253E5C3|nr:SRPBCC family protein [Erythrobacter sp. EC-HK427]VVS95872.1 conserved hypothetical protein [Erythrobacter sp. EC-HK427]
MFGLFKAKPAHAGMVSFTLAMDIACAADELFGLVNPAAPTFWKRAAGRLETIAPGRFRLHLHSEPECVRTLVVTEAEPGRVLALDTQATPRTGYVVSKNYRYCITPVDARNCTVTLHMEARFVPGLGKRDYDTGCRAVAEDLHTTLSMLKVHAEQGAGMVCRIDRLQSAA